MLSACFVSTHDVVRMQFEQGSRAPPPDLLVHHPGGMCGTSGVMTNFKQEWRRVNGTENLVCGMRQKDRDRLISIHANCCSGAEAKRDAMTTWQKMTIDENLYKSEASTYRLMYYPWLHDPRNKTGAVFPDW